MRINRIYAIFLRYFFVILRLDTLADLVFWPLVDILLWGITSKWLQQGHTTAGNIALSIMCALIFWQVLWRTQYDICVNLLKELWSKNLTNLFGSPLKLSEWVCGTMLLGVFKALFTIFFGIGIVYLFYDLNFFELGISIVPLLFLFFLSGWALGFFSAAFIVFYGQRLQQLAWMTPYIVAPFSAIFYPLDALPGWAQNVAVCLPTTALFQEMRSLLQGNALNYNALIIPALLSVGYLSLSILFFVHMFNKRKEKGLLGFD